MKATSGASMRPTPPTLFAIPLACVCAALATLLAASLLFTSWGLAEELPQAITTPKAAKPTQYVPSVEEARRQAILLHATIHASLQIVHDRLYREDEGLPIPAAILKGVFHDLEKEHHVKLKWLAVEGQAMNTDHKPQDPFELEAAKALKARRPEYEQVKGNTFRRAAPIRLSNHCLKCHVPNRRSTRDHVAGLIIQIPVQAKAPSRSE